VFQLQEAQLVTLLLDFAISFRCTQQMNKVDVWPTRKKLLSPCALALAPGALLALDS